MASESDSSSGSGKSSRPDLALASLPEIEKVFNRFDANHDGLISSSELAAVLSALGSGSSPAELDRMMEEMDSDKDGFINLHEFADFCTRKVEGDESGVKELHDAFQLYDEDKNGLISAVELHKVLTQLGEHCTVQDCGKMIQSVDSDGDGNVSFEEFKKMMSSKNNAS